MATITANTGSNAWNTNAAWVGGVQPSATSDVVIPASAVVTIPTATTVLGRSLTVQASGTLAFASTTAVLTLGDATAGASNVAISISATATITLTGIGTINLNSTSATQQTIASGGKTLPNLTFGGAGSSYLLSAAIASSGTITVNNGTFNTGNFAVTAASFSCGNASARTLTFGSSTITVSASSVAFGFSGITNLTVTANTATVVVTTTAAGGNTVVINSFNWNGLSFSFTGGGSIIASISGATVGTFTYTGTAVKSNSLSISGSFTCAAFVCNGNSLTNRVIVQSNTLGTARTITAAAVTITNTDFADITGAGAGTWSGTSIGNALGNSGITFTTPVTRYGVVAGNWSSTATWSSNSGGSGGSSVPLCHDDVYLDANSAAGTYVIDIPRFAKNIDCTGFTRTLNFGVTGNTCFGSATWASGMTFANTQSSTFSGRGTHTITSAGKTMVNSVNITAFGGTYTLQDAFACNGSFLHNTGTFVTGNNTMSVNLFSSVGSGTRTFTGGTSVITAIATSASTLFGIATTGLTSSFENTTFVISVASANRRTVAGGGATLGTLRYTVAGSTGGLDITGANTFTSIEFSDTSNARTLRFTAGTTTTVTSWNVNGTSGKLMTVSSITAATHTLSKPSGTVSSDYVSLTNSIATGGASWYAGANSTDGGGNTGWLFTDAPVTSTGFLAFF